ncbi:MAG: hypothetical protein QM702_10670 [Rubrivivax sp.]
MPRDAPEQGVVGGESASELQRVLAAGFRATSSIPLSSSNGTRDTLRHQQQGAFAGIPVIGIGLVEHRSGLAGAGLQATPAFRQSN